MRATHAHDGIGQPAQRWIFGGFDRSKEGPAQSIVWRTDQSADTGKTRHAEIVHDSDVPILPESSFALRVLTSKSFRRQRVLAALEGAKGAVPEQVARFVLLLAVKVP